MNAAVTDLQLQLRWQTTASDAYPLERTVRWSADEGARWQALAIKLDEDAAIAPLANFSSGRTLVQVIVSDGFHGTTSDAVAVDIPRRPPTVAILWPVDGCTVRTDEPVRLWGVATAADGSAIAAEDMRWILDDETAGSGPESWATLASYDGEHRARLQVRHDEQWASASVRFNSNCSGRPAYRSSRKD